MVEPTKKITPIYESNPPNKEENPGYVVSRIVGAVVEEIPESPKEEVPGYVVGKDVSNNTDKEDINS